MSHVTITGGSLGKNGGKGLYEKKKTFYEKVVKYFGVFGDAIFFIQLYDAQQEMFTQCLLSGTRSPQCE